MLYSLLYPHNFDDEGVLYEIFKTLDAFEDSIVLEMDKKRNVEQLIKLIAKRLGIKILEITEPTKVSDKIIIIYRDGVHEIHDSQGIKC
jgi:hypothetical protein